MTNVAPFPVSSPKSSLGRTIAYWVTTVLVVFVFGLGGVVDLMQPPQAVEGVAALGYPVYLCAILGVWKVLGAIALVLPGTPRLKEWAYAGMFFDLTGAAASHFAVHDPAAKVAIPLVITLILVASWDLRPASRRLAGPLV
ncbi:MAG TPA: DoxX family protein [Planctomycetaceae bacterium]|jgi:uncharacterized membrane protein YphA (DoxX/SURF4 family)|nr:DoxX family protein [Planctomycetaceae bacterium]